MKQTHTAIICLALLVTMVSCQKESDTVTLGVRIDDIAGNQKLYINGNTPQWEDGDPIWINSNGDYTVTINNNTAQIANVARDENNQYTAVFPAGIVTSQNSDRTVNINLPREQEYHSSNNVQSIMIPMIAYNDGNDLHFKNLCSLVKVNITNTTGNSISINRITLTASTARLSGPTTASITVDNQNNKYGQLGTWDNEAEHDVSLVFPSPENISGTSRDFYIAVPEFGNTELSIIIYTNDNRFLPVLKNSVNLAHNSIATVSVAISDQNPLLTTQEVFTVDGNNTKVRFSKGNLQYTTDSTHSTADGTATGTWRFAKHQYDFIGSANSNISTSYDGWIDLFGWGTSGYNNKVPTLSSNSYSDYYYSMNISTRYYDWGLYNNIDNYTYGTWRTPTRSEWEHILATRAGVSIGETYTDARYAVSKVNGVKGLMLFPDGFQWPTNSINPPSVCNGYESNWNNRNYSIAQWAILESAGIIFLPAAGYRTGSTIYDSGESGWYWTSTKVSNRTGMAYDIIVEGDHVSENSGQIDIFNGLSVRLVRNSN